MQLMNRPRCCHVVKVAQPGVMAELCPQNAARVLSCSDANAEDGEYKYALYCDEHMPPLADITWYRFTKQEVSNARHFAWYRFETQPNLKP